MLERFGQVVARWWLFFLAGWAALLLGTMFAAPRWGDVAEGGEFAFLPEDAPSRQGERIFVRAFPERAGQSTVVLVLRRAAPGDELDERDHEFIRDVLRPRLQGVAGRHEIVTDLALPDEAALRPLLLSGDNRAALAIVDLAADFHDLAIWPPLDEIEDLLDELRRGGEVPPGLELALTGSATIGRDRTRARAASAETVQFWTVALLVILLLAVYRAPLLVLIPLATLFVGVTVALNLLALMARAGWVGVFEGLEIYTLVIAYGAGVDYSLFFISRHREGLERRLAQHAAVVSAVAMVGAAVAASAGTEMFGIGMMTFAEFRKFQQAGIAIPFSLFVVLCASLTLTMPLLRLLGPWAYWPRFTDPEGRALTGLRRLTRAAPSRDLWKRIGGVLERRPGTVWLLGTLAMAPLVTIALLFYDRLSFGPVGDMPPGVPSLTGTGAIQEHFPDGQVGPVTAVLHSETVDFRTGNGMALVEELTRRLDPRLDELQIAEIRNVARPLGQARADAAERAESPQEPLPLRLLERVVGRRRATEQYVTGVEELGGGVTRMEIVLEIDPFSRGALARLDDVAQAIRAELPRTLREDAQVFLVGTTAGLRDLKQIAHRDRLRINLMVAAAVLAVLVLLLRRVALPVYLILTVAFSFLAALGGTYALFWLLDPDGFPGLDWTVPIFLFTLLIAVGVDYNILLVTRIEEEEREHGPVEGVTQALVRTGTVISSCGIIMAGTFSALAVGGQLSSMRQLGFALAFGILLDTFIVRPILVPSFLILARRGTLGALGRFF